MNYYKPFALEQLGSEFRRSMRQDIDFEHCSAARPCRTDLRKIPTTRTSIERPLGNQNAPDVHAEG